MAATTLIAVFAAGCFGSRRNPNVDMTPVTHSGDRGRVVLAQGAVTSAEGSPASSATVTADQDTIAGPRHHYVVTTNSAGKYAVRGPAQGDFTNVIWAATSDGRLGAAWLNGDPKEPRNIRLWSGETRIYVYDSRCKPMAGAEVTVASSGIGDTQETTPPNVRTILRRTTNENGEVVYPSRLSDHHLSIQIRTAKESKHLTQDLLVHQDNEVHVVVIGGTERERATCRAIIRASLAEQDAKTNDADDGSPVASESNGEQHDEDD